MEQRQHRAQVEILGPEAERVALASCFFTTWLKPDGTVGWAGFLANVAPPGAVQAGTLVLRFSGVEQSRVEVRALSPGGYRRQATFRGIDSPPDL